MLVKLKHKRRRSRPDRIDPTRTVTVRKRYVAEIRRRFARLRGDIVRLMLDDVFGIKRRLVGNVFCATGEGGGIDPSCSPGGVVGGTREEIILAKAEKITVTDEIATTSIDSYDYDGIKDRMTREELDDMESDIESGKQTYIDELMEDFNPDVDRKSIANDKDLDHDTMIDKIKELIEKHTDTKEDEERLIEELTEGITFRSRHYADDTVDHVIDSLTNAPETLIDKLKELRDETREELDKAITEEEEQQQDEVRRQYDYDYDTSNNEVDWLRQFYMDNKERFTESNCVDDTWCKDHDGDGVYVFKTTEGSNYKVSAVKKPGLPYPDMQFSDSSGSYDVTGAGNALEVFGKVVPAMVAYIKKQDLDGATFSAAEPSRQRLYDRLVKTIAKTMPDYFAVLIDRGTTRYYGIGKRAKRDEVLDSVRDKVGVQEFRVIVNVAQENWWAEKSWQVLTVNASLDDSKRAWQFATSSEQVKAFQEWLRERFGHHLSIKELMRRFAEEGYKRGIGRAFDDVEIPYAQAFAMDLSTGDFYVTSKTQFLKSAFGSPVGKERINQLASRSFDDLKNITSDMSTRMSRTLLEGLVDGSHPNDIAKRLSKDVGISLSRAETIARTEIIRAHAEGQLDAMKAMGVGEVGVQVEWLTAKDESVCPRCAAMEGVVLDIDKAHNLIPTHPSCRCAWAPAGDVLYPKPIDDAADEGFTENVFCATGEGGGIDPTCSPSVTKDTDKVYSTVFAVGKKDFFFEAQKDEEGWHVGFGLTSKRGGDTSRMENDPNTSALQVLRSVQSSLVKFIEEKRPDTILFTGEKFDKSRVKLYDRLVFEIGKAYGYSGEIKEYPALKEYVLRRITTNAADDTKRSWQFRTSSEIGDLTAITNLVNVFCATGEGGGVDPTCSPGGGSSDTMGSPKANPANKEAASALIAKLKGYKTKAGPARVKQLADVLSKLTVKQLNELKAEHAIDVKGKKAELIERLTAKLKDKINSEKGKTVKVDPPVKPLSSPTPNDPIAALAKDATIDQRLDAVFAHAEKNHPSQLTEKEHALMSDAKIVLQSGSSVTKKQYDKARKEYDDLYKKAVEVSKNRQEAIAKQREVLLKAFTVDTPADIKTGSELPYGKPGSAYTPKLPEEKEAMDNAVRFIQSLTAQNGQDDPIFFHFYKHASDGRAHQTQREYINVGDSQKNAGVLVHEMAHALEDQKPGTLEKMRGFLVKRTTGEVPTKIGFSSKTRPEYGLDDDFKKVFGASGSYVGKTYPNGSTMNPKTALHTEVLSMGLQKLYEDPIRFIRKDREYAKLIIEVLRDRTYHPGSGSGYATI